MKKPPAIFYGILNMGLGHAARSLPILRALAAKGWRITIGSSGRALVFLKQEMPDARFVTVPDYGLTYSRRGVEWHRIAAGVPGFLVKVREEQALLQKLNRDTPFDLVIADHRYGCYLNTVPSFIISHQLRFIAPSMVRPLEGIGARFNRHFYRKFTGVIVPDARQGAEGLLTGRLSRINHLANVSFPGILSSLIREEGVDYEYDLLVAISGPEPQRTVFEKIIRSQITHVPGRKVLLLGKPESGEAALKTDDLLILPHASRARVSSLFNRSRLVVSRSGYSTVMELAELGGKALFVPTPGQTEQTYLAARFLQKGWFYSVPQERLNLKEDVERARTFPGFPRRFSTAESVQAVIGILERHLSR